MPKQDASSRLRDPYWKQTHRPLNALAFLLPLLLFFHIGAGYLGPGSLLAVQDLRKLGNLLGIFGPTAVYLPAILLVAALMVQQLARRDPWTIQPKAVVGIGGEALLWAMPLVALNLVVGKPLQAGGGAKNTLLEGLVYAVGAGIYEEFIFRLLFVGIAVLVLADIFNLRRELVAAVAVVAAAACFGLYHFSSEQIRGQLPFQWGYFIYCSVAGIFLGGLFLLRGFGVAVGAHAALNVLAALLKHHHGS